jgi:hypothetical protein
VVTKVRLDRRVADLEAAVGRLRPPAPAEARALLVFVDDDGLDQLELIYSAAEYDRRELSAAEQLKALSIFAAALARQAEAG